MKHCTPAVLVGALTLWAFSDVAHADQIFSDETAFLSAADSGLSFESFEGLTADNNPNGNTFSLVSTSGFDVTTPIAAMSIYNYSTDGGLHPTDGSKYIVWVASSSSALTFSFPSPVNTFGVTLTDPVDFTTPASLSLTTDGGASFPDFVTSQQASGAEVFVGIITGAEFSSVTISPSDPGNEGIGVDSVHSGSTAVPEPSGIALWGASSLLLLSYGWAKRRCRKRR
jgi:hypothetical protein